MRSTFSLYFFLVCSPIYFSSCQNCDTFVPPAVDLAKDRPWILVKKTEFPIFEYHVTDGRFKAEIIRDSNELKDFSKRRMNNTPVHVNLDYNKSSLVAVFKEDNSPIRISFWLNPERYIFMVKYETINTPSCDPSPPKNTYIQIYAVPKIPGSWKLEEEF